MKNLTRIMSASMLVAMSLTSSYAWEKPHNPDRFLSIGLNADWKGAEGTWGPLSQDQNHYAKLADVKTDVAVYQADVRFPISNNVTLEGRFNYTHSQSKYLTNDYSTYEGEIDDQKGTGYGLGVRYYFNGK